MRSYIKMLPIFLLGTILFLSIGFSAFSSNLTIGDIKASVRPTKNIRVTAFYAKDNSNLGHSSWEEYSSNKIVTSVYLPNADSSVSYIMEITNLDSEVMAVESITGLPDNLTYRLEDYKINDKLCNNDKCNLGVKKRIKIVLENKDGFTLDDETVIGIDITFKIYTYRVSFNANSGSGSMIPLDLKYNEQANLPSVTFTKQGYRFKEWNTKADGTGTSYNNEQSIIDINTNEEEEVVLYAIWEKNDGIYYPGLCVFNGEGVDVEGACAEGKHVDYINTGVEPFNDENYQKNFVLTLTINSVDDDHFKNTYRPTLFNMLYEEEDEVGKYPGALLRGEGGKWFLQGSRGKEPDYTNKILFNKEDLLGKEFKLIRYNDGSSIKLYYVIDGHGPYLLKDITDLSSTFNTPLTFGASLEEDNTTVMRHIKATVSDISFEFAPDGTSLSDLAGIDVIPEDERVMVTVFAQEGTCTFNGASQNITGSDCSLYHDINYINTDIRLFSNENLSKDFDLTFTMSNYDTSTQEDSQVTMMNAFLERNTAGYGMLLRRNRSNLEFIIRDGNGQNKTVTFKVNEFSSLRIIKKGNNVCYDYNNKGLKYIINFDNFADPFSVPVTFGGSINKEGVPFRFITADMSNMVIKMGHFDESVICNESMR